MSTASSNLDADPAATEEPTRKPSKFGHGLLTTAYGLLLYGVPPIIASFVLVFAAIALSVGFGMREGWLEATTGQFTFILIVEALAIGLLIILMRATRETWRSIGVLKPQLTIVGYMLVAFAAYYLLFIILAVIANMILPLDLEQEQELGFEIGVGGSELLIVFVSLVVLPPLVEEIVFRGFLYSRYRRVFSVFWSAVFVSILFAVGHLQLGTGNTPLWVAAIDTFVLSMVLVWLREKTGNIWAGVGVHALKNGLAFYILFIRGIT